MHLFFKKRCLRIIILKNKGHFTCLFSLHFSWGWIRSSSVLCVSFAVGILRTLLDLAVHRESVWKFAQALCCFGTQTPWFWPNARLLNSVFDNWTMKATKNYWGKILWFFKNKTLLIQGLCSAANVSHVICKNWGNFQGIVGSQFTWNSQQICQQPGLIENPGKGVDLGVKLSLIKLC